MNKGENMPEVLFDVIEYIKYAEKRYMRDYCLHKYILAHLLTACKMKFKTGFLHF